MFYVLDRCTNVVVCGRQAADTPAPAKAGGYADFGTVAQEEGSGRGRFHASMVSSARVYVVKSGDPLRELPASEIHVPQFLLLMGDILVSEVVHVGDDCQ